MTDQSPTGPAGRPGDAEVRAGLARSLPRQRFFAGGIDGDESLHIVHRAPLAGAGAGAPAIEVVVVDVRDAAGSGAARYFVPLLWVADGAEPPSGGEVLVEAAGLRAFDAPASPEGAAALGAALASARTGAGTGPTLRTVPGATFAAPGRAKPMGVEQSNTSVVFDGEVMCKFFRRLHPGPNPDVELSAALTTAGCRAVPPLVGWAELNVAGGTCTVAMLQRFVAGSSDGWELAIESARAAVSAGAAGMGGPADFSAAAAELGEAVADVHRSLATALPRPAPVPAEEIIAPMRARLAHVASVVPQVKELSDAARTVFDAAAASLDGDAEVQRIHGDLHLGQVLHSGGGWLLIDFEGEPSRPWDERRLPDHPLRDIAGMVRSFDYAAHFPLMDVGDAAGTGGTGTTGDAAGAAADWAARCIGAFLDGYARVTGADPRARRALLDAFILDKAIYECLYESQHRPGWLPLPLGAVRRILDNS